LTGKEIEIYHLVAASLCLFLYLAALAAEQARLSRRRFIPRRISVTGTRGKSSVVRLLAAMLRASGQSVAAKTTGSKPVYIHTDGREEELLRRGKPTILEQKDVLRAALKEKAHWLVLEAMGIRAEVLAAEIQRIVRPQVLVITNVRADHAAQLGEDKEKIASSFAAAIPPGGLVFVPEEESMPEFSRVALKRGAELILVPREDVEISGRVSPSEFEVNIRLASAVARHFSQTRQDIAAGIGAVNPDFGSLRLWELPAPGRRETWRFVSAFAANDPQSTLKVLAKLAALSPPPKRMVGLLNLRRERADRSLQWKKVLEDGGFPRLQRIYVLGDQVRAFVGGRRRGGSELIPIREKNAADITRRVMEGEPEGTLAVGLGNMGGMGRRLVEYWDKEGKRRDL
jgi:poly-gamma-glutamate synthase PgsB/CapB